MNVSSSGFGQNSQTGWRLLLRLIVSATGLCVATHGWIPTAALSRVIAPRIPPTFRSHLLAAASSSSEATSSNEDQEEDWETIEEATYPNTKVLRFLETKYPSFYNILCRDNDEWLVALRGEGAPGTTDNANGGTCHTLFVPSEDAFSKLGSTKLEQLQDPRNIELRDKIASCHLLLGEPISAVQLKTEDWTKGRPKDGTKPNTVIAGFTTMGGQEIPVGRRKSGGILGTNLLAKEDGEIVIGPAAQIVRSFQVEGCLVHEMDDLISSPTLWRYADQLRIPGF